jgi:type II secretion system protein H
MKERRLSRGFTLIEITVIIAILLVLASAILPRLSSFVESQRERSFMQKLVALTAQAREQSIKRGKDVTVQFEESNRTFSIQYTDDSQNQSTLQSLVMPTTLDASKFKVGQSTTGAADFKLTFYPDGTSDGGGVEVSRRDVATSITSVVVEKATGAVSMVRDSLPEVGQQSWQAGDYVHRAG